MNQLERDVLETLNQYQMIRPGDCVLIGLSGGADSVCLLRVLYRLQMDGRLPEKVSLAAVHIHHGLRSSADGDENFVRELCAELGVPVRIYHVDAAGTARNLGMSLEEAGRSLRREVFAREARRLGRNTAVALAHHREDSAETLLFHLCRGTSMAGLTGIRPVSFLEQEGAVPLENPPERATGEEFSPDPGAERQICQEIRVLRPLIYVSRDAIEAWLKLCGQSWREDETNSDTRYARNALRHVIFPELERWINPAAEKHMAGAARELAEAEDSLEEMTERIFRQCCREAPGVLILQVEVLLSEWNEFWQRRVLYLALVRVRGGKKDISGAHIRALQGILASGGSVSLDLPGGVRARKEYGNLMLYGPESCSMDMAGQESAGCQAGIDTACSADMAGQGGCGCREETKADCPPDRCVPFGKRVPENICGGRCEPAFPDEAEEWLPLSGEVYSFRLLRYDGGPVPMGRYTKWLDYDRISTPIQMRTRKAGDRIAIGRNADGTLRHKRLTRVMIDRKIPERIRERIVLPMAGNEVLWFPGYRISEQVLVGTDTQQVLEISIQRPD